LAFRCRIQLLTVSLLGFISYAIIKAFSGRPREISWLTYVLAIVLVLNFVFVRSRMS
jgi:xanthine/uracil/vitamin C permease (AzgA family)